MSPTKLQKKTVSSKIKRTLNLMELEHKQFQQTVSDIRSIVQRIEINSENMAETLSGFRDDNRKHLELLKDSYQNNTTHLQIIAGKKQVPISIFAIVVILLCTLLVASEVRYSGLDINLSTSGIHVDPGKKNSN